MKDLEKYDADPLVDTWRKTGRIPDLDAGEPEVGWTENKKWLQERIDRGDAFKLGTDPATLGGSLIKGQPNGNFTYREIRELENQGIYYWHDY